MAPRRQYSRGSMSRIANSACFGAILGVVVIVAIMAPAIADALTIVSWNAKAALAERLESRLGEIKRMAEDLNADVLVLVEVGGNAETKMIAEGLGWKSFYAVASNWAIATDSIYKALEAAIISKIPIQKVTEYDASPDGYHEVFSEQGELRGRVNEQLLSLQGIAGFGNRLGSHDRGTMRVDLANDLSIFPVHLKSNRNSACIALDDAVAFHKRHGYRFDPALLSAKKDGFPGATKERIKNAEKRERVIAAVSRLGADAVTEGRVVVLAGDMNTAFEHGKFGMEIADCVLRDFTCEKGPFPASACEPGDGFDDTLGILVGGLVGGMEWIVLSRKLDRTFKDGRFADLAIDHIAVPAQFGRYFSSALKAKETYGSDHFPITTIFTR